MDRQMSCRLCLPITARIIADMVTISFELTFIANQVRNVAIFH